MEPQLYERFFEIEDHFWWSVGTRRMFFQLIDGLPRSKAARVLDVGCGTGVTLKECPPGWRLVGGCDLSDVALSFCRRRGLSTLVRCDATRLAYASDSFDLVLALDVVEHLDDDAACLAEITRVCRRGGYALVHVPAFPFLWSDKDVQNHHRRRYRRAELRQLVERCGLRIHRMLYVNVGVFPLAMARSFVQRMTHRGTRASTSDTARGADGLYDVSDRLNRLLTGWMEFERRMSAHWAPPFGMSLVCLAEKP